MNKKPEIIFLERRLFEETTLQTVKRDLENFETLSDGETYLYETITHHIEELIKNWKNGRAYAKIQSKLGKELSL